MTNNFTAQAFQYNFQGDDVRRNKAVHIVNRKVSTALNGGLKKFLDQSKSNSIFSGIFTIFPFFYFSDSVSALTEVLLVNVMYFKSDWQKSFKSETSLEDFHRTNGGPVKVDMMYGDLMNVGYIQENKAQILAIPFQGENYHMVLVLPSQDRGNRGKIYT